MINRKNDLSKSQTVISEGTKIEGKFFFPGTAKIDGEIIGDIDAENIFVISKTGKVQSTLKTKNAVIAGTFEGDMHATESVEITSTGKFIGNLIQDKAKLTIEKGGLFKGSSSLNGKHDKQDFIKELRVSELRD